jgi:mRNA interferase MazF
MVKKEYVPERGDIVWVDFSPTVGHEQGGKRPALILSPLPYHQKSAIALMCPITGTVRNHPFEVVIPEGHDVQGAILVNHVKSIDWRMRKATFKGKMSPEVVNDVLERLMTLIEPETE